MLFGEELELGLLDGVLLGLLGVFGVVRVGVFREKKRIWQTPRQGAG